MLHENYCYVEAVTMAVRYHTHNSTDLTVNKNPVALNNSYKVRLVTMTTHYLKNSGVLSCTKLRLATYCYSCNRDLKFDT